MSQLSAALLALQRDSLFLKGYQTGMKKSAYWEVTLEDSLNLIANLPKVAALIYRCSFHDGMAAILASILVMGHHAFAVFFASTRPRLRALHGCCSLDTQKLGVFLSKFCEGFLFYFQCVVVFANYPAGSE
jgi:hypothetical protein